MRHELVVDLARPKRRRARFHERPIALERRTLVDRAEHHAKSDVRPDIDVRRGEAVAGDLLGAVELILDRGERRSLAAPVADHRRALDRDDDAERLVGVRRFDRPGGEEQPAEVGTALGVRRRREAN